MSETHANRHGKLSDPGLSRSLPGLRDDDQAAVDEALRVVRGERSEEGLSSRGVRALALLRMTDMPGLATDPALVDAVLAAIDRTVREQAAQRRTPALADGGEEAAHELVFVTDEEAALLDDDADALDALASEGYDPSRVASGLRTRAHQLARLGDLISRTPVAGGDAHTGTHAEASTAAPGAMSLIDRTMARVEREQREGVRRMAQPRESVGPSRGWRLADVVSVAGVLLLGVSVVWPMAAAVRSHQQRVACAGNMGESARALSLYGADFAGVMPLASASIGGLSWWDVGKDVSRSNSANLYTLARTGYTGVQQLACHGNRTCVERLPKDAMDWRSLPEVSYSYFVMFGTQRPRLDGSAGTAKTAPDWTPSTTVVLADRSPVVLRAARGQVIYPEENSPNHGGTGQWTLRLDGSARWLDRPVVGVGASADNIWLPAQVEEVLRAIDLSIRSGQVQGVIPLGTREAAAGRRAVSQGVSLSGTETAGSASDSFLGP